MGERARRLLAFLFFGVVATMACSGSGNGSGEPADVPRPGELRIGVGEDIWPLYGTGPRSRTFALSPNLNVFEPLVFLNQDYTLRPALAERWEFVEPNTWRFHLRPGVTFHDGEPFDAASARHVSVYELP